MAGIEVAFLPALVAGCVLILLAVGVFVVDPGDPLHRALGLLAGFKGLAAFLQGWGTSALTLPGVLRIYVIIAIPFAAIHFAHRFWVFQYPANRRKPLHRIVIPVSLLAGAVAALGAFAIDHASFFDEQAIEPGPLFLFGPLSNIGIAALAFWFLRSQSRHRLSVRRKAVLLVGLGLALSSMHQASFGVAATFIGIVEGFPSVSDLLADGWLLTERILFAGSFVIALASLRVLARRARRHDAARNAAFVLAGAAFTGLVSAALFWAFVTGRDVPFGPVHFAFDAMWQLLAAILIGIAVLRFQFLGIDLRAKWALRQSTVAAIAAGAFFVLSESLELLVPVEDTWLALASAAAIAVAIRPIQHAATRFADRVLPIVERDDYMAGRRREMYEAAVEAFLADGRVTKKEHRVLLSLRERLGLSMEEGQRIEKAFGLG